jgi:RNA polymerase sigma factor (sigma-70 family)
MDRTDELADRALIEQFLGGDEIDSNDAFSALIQRHGPMVLETCRRVLANDADAEDAFQATFLELARRGSSIRNRAILAAWLSEVAYRKAMKLRIKIIRRRSIESQSMATWPTQLVVPDSQHPDAVWNQLRPILHEEVRRLPAKYRIAVILSYLEGKTNEEVAAPLRWPVGTVKGRLSRARALLRLRLARRGIALSAVCLCTISVNGMASADVVRPELVKRTLLYVQNADPRTASRGASSTPAQRWTQWSCRTGIKGRSVSVLQHPRLVVKLLSVLFIATAIGIAIAIHSRPSRISTFLKSAIAALSPGRSSGGPCD